MDPIGTTTRAAQLHQSPLLDHGSYWDHHKSGPAAPITPVRLWILLGPPLERTSCKNQHCWTMDPRDRHKSGQAAPIPLLDHGFYRDHQKSGPTAPIPLLDYGFYRDHQKSGPTAPFTPVRPWILLGPPQEQPNCTNHPY